MAIPSLTSIRSLVLRPSRLLVPFLFLAHWSCTGSGAVSPLTPSKASQPDSASTADSEVLYWAPFPMAQAPSDPLNGVYLVSKDLGWACGNNGLILKWDGTTWSKADTDLAKNENLLAVKFSNENEGWAVGSHGIILSYKNGTWSQESSPTQENLYGLDVTRSRTVWVAGANGTLLTYNGVSWGKVSALGPDSPGSTPVTVLEDLYGLGLSDQNNGWAVGARGTILRYDGRKWQAYANSPSSEKLNSVSVISDVQAWAVGAYGNILRFNGTTWNKMGSAFSGFDLYQVYMKDDNNGWAVGQDGTLVYYDGSRWISHPKPTGKPSLNALSFYKDLGFAVGSNGAILKYQPNGEQSKFSFLFKGEAAKPAAKNAGLWTLTYTLMNQSPKGSSFATFYLPVPKGFEPYQPKATPTPAATAAPSPVPTQASPVPGAAATPSPQDAAPTRTPLPVAGTWKFKDNSLELEVGTVASLEMKTVQVQLREKKGEKKEYPVVLKAVLRSADNLLTEAAPLTLLAADPSRSPQAAPSPSASQTPANPQDPAPKDGRSLVPPTPSGN